MTSPKTHRASYVAPTTSGGPTRGPGAPAADRAGTSTSLLRARLDRARVDGRLTLEQVTTILETAERGLLNGDLVGGPGGPGPALDLQPGH